MFFVGLVVSVVIALSRVNLETLRGEIGHILSNAVGMPVEIRGEIKWRFSLTPRVALSDVAIESADWAKNKDGVHIDSVIAKLDLLSLLGTPEIESLILTNPVVYLEQNDKGQYSLTPAADDVKEDDAQSADAHPSKFPFSANLEIDSILLENPRLIMIDSSSKSELNLREFYAKYKRGRNYMEYSGSVSVDDQEYSFIISFSALDAERKVYPIRVAIANKLTPITASIALEQTSKLPIDFVIKGSIADAREVASHFDIQLPKIAPMTLNISGGMGHDKITIKNSDIEFGESNLSLSGFYSWANKKPQINATIKSKEFILGEVFAELYGAAKTPWKRPNRPLNVFKETPLYSEYLNIANAEIKIDFANLTAYRNLSINNIKADIKVNDGALNINTNARFMGGDIHVALDAFDSRGALVARGAGRGRGVVVGKIPESIGEKNIVRGLPADFDFYLEGRGRDLSGLMGTITGPVQIRSSGGGTALPDMAEYLYGQDFLTSVRHSVQDMVTERDKYDKVAISCAAINLKLRNGVVETERGIALQTNAVNMRAAGRVDLGKETLDASMASTPVRGLKLSITGNVVNAMEFKGNLAEPDINFNGGSMIGRTAATAGLGMLVLAPFTGGLSLVAGAGVGFLAGDLLNNWLSDEHPCETAISKGAPEMDGDPRFLNRPLTELVGEMVKS
jgi:hypothetical protein